MMPELEPIGGMGERQQGFEDLRDIRDMERVQEGQQIQQMQGIQEWQGAIQPDGVPVGEHPWDQQLPLEEDEITEVMCKDFGYESGEECELAGGEDPRNMRSFPGSFPTRVEIWSAREIDAWIDIAERLKEKAAEYRNECDFEGWLDMRYEHDAARTVIAKLLGDLNYLRSGTHREVWWVPDNKKRLEDFGDLNWLPAAQVSEEERDAWLQYSELLEALDALRKQALPIRVQAIIEAKVDVAWAVVNQYMDIQKERIKEKVKDRELAMVVIRAKDDKEDREVEQDAGRRAGQRETGEPAHIVQIEDDEVPLQ